MPLRFGMLGCGYWARHLHLPGLAAAPGVTLVGVWGRRAEAAEEAGRAFGVPGFADLEALLAQVEAVAIALPPDAQPALAVAAARHGCHLLLEKPLAFTTADARAVAEAVERAGVAQASFVTRRYVPELMEEVSAIAADGPWERAHGHLHSGALLPGTPYTDCAWRIARGALWDIGPHALSVLLPALGPVEAVLGCQERDHVTTLRLRHRGGVLSETTLSLHAAPDACGETYVFEAERRRRTLAVTLPPRPDSYARALSALCAAVAGTAPRTSLDADIAMVRILEAAEGLRSRA